MLLTTFACSAAGPTSAEQSETIRDLEGRVWRQEACPVGGDTSMSLFSPRRPADDEILDVDPGKDWLGYEVVRAVDLELAEGWILETGGEYLGEDDYSTGVEVAEPGTYPFFLLLSNYSGSRGRPALAQIVFDPDATPVRWEVDSRFGFSTDGGAGYLGSPDAVPLAVGEFDDDIFWWFVEPQVDEAEDRFCWQYRHDGGSNFVVYENGYGDGGFPGAAGYDAAGDLVAITWFFGWESWLLAGIPGTPPAPITEMLECRQRLVDDGVPYPETAWCPEED